MYNCCGISVGFQHCTLITCTQYLPLIISFMGEIKENLSWGLFFENIQISVKGGWRVNTWFLLMFCTM